ncbi:hypothetical protein [Streptomyces griseoluteus]|uniref:hypothetical protein n=1 Tax=Streptomyces griseoluteus TaxID=29306 RepID=UPI00341A0FF1
MLPALAGVLIPACSVTEPVRRGRRRVPGGPGAGRTEARATRGPRDGRRRAPAHHPCDDVNGVSALRGRG